ncbi:MAG: cation transporter [Deltaproteobacteria bacterium]|nr:cation transporter [Deltaproteobacteria bacterium]
MSNIGKGTRLEEHAHSHPHPHRLSSRRRLAVAFWTQAVFFAVELVGGLLTNSLALLADAGHMLSDVGALGLSLLALYWMAKPPTARKTYGYHRLEILVALVNGLILWGMAAYILYEAYFRFYKPPAISGLPMLIIASLGLLVNLLGMFILFPHREHSLNIRSAFLHLLADSLGSVAAMAAGAAILWQGWYWFDPLAGAVVGVMIIVGSWQLVWEAADILLEATPKHIDLAQVQAALEAHPGVAHVHDLHVWTIASGIYALSVHVGVDGREDRDCLTWELEELLRKRFGLEHATIQTEGPDYQNPRVCPLNNVAEALNHKHQHRD